jgi:hypothetical protein
VNAVYAGMLAWAIEISVVAMMLLLLKYEENKVIENRTTKTKRVEK